jgi:hypothetical protein
MTVDYDAPRRTSADDDEADRLEVLPRGRAHPGVAVLDDDSDAADDFVLPDSDLSSEDLVVRVVPRQPDEFTCSRCFLVFHRNRRIRGTNGDSVCADCA